MAEQVEAAQELEATQETAPSDTSTQSTVGLDELEAVMRRVAQEENGKMWATVRQHLTPLQQQAKVVEQIASDLMEVKGNNAQTRALVQKLALGESVTTEEMHAIESAHQQAEEQRRVKAENEQLKQRLQAESEAKAQMEANKPKLSPVEVLQYEWDTYYGPMLDRLAKAEGLSLQEVSPLLPKNLKPGATQKDWQRYLDDAEKAIKSEADKRHRAKKPPVETPPEKSGGTPEPTSARELIKAGWEERLRKAG